MSDTSSFEEDIDIDDVSPLKISHFPTEIVLFEESPSKKDELTDAKTSGNDSSSDKSRKLISCESFKSDSSSAKKTHAQLCEIDFSTLFEKHNLSETGFTVQKQNAPFTQSSESNCFGLNKEQESSKSGFQKSENGCIFPDKICDLADNKTSKSDFQSSEFDYQLSKNNSQPTEEDYGSPGCDLSFLIKKIALPDDQLSKSDGSSLDEKCEISDDQSIKKFSDSSDKSPEIIPDQLLDDCSYISSTPSLGSEYCSSNEKYNSTHSSEKNPSSSPSEKCDFTDTSGGISSEVGIDLDVKSPENVYSLSNRQCTLSGSPTSESDTSTFSHYKSTPETYLPASNEPSNSSYTHSHETDYYTSHQRALLNGGEFPNYNRIARKVFRELLGDDFSIYTTESTSAESSDIENLPPQLKPRNIESCDVCNQPADDCEKKLRQIIRTADQFTSSSHRKNVTLKDIEKAFKVHKVDSMLAKYYFCIDETESAAPTNGE